MNSRGQALVEAAVVLPLLVVLIAVLMKLGYSVWADLVIDREAHHLVICALRGNPPHQCQQNSRQNLRRLLHWGECTHVEVRRQISPRLEHSASATILCDFGKYWGRVRARRRLTEREIPAVSRRWR